ncbi:MAG TPA: hypothetical protein VFS54_02805 [Solirubrobacterales bacterium]|nr:hypothetical protein [Solirubrobacterales bacterium]
MSGVITGWGFNASVPGLEELPYTMKLKVLRPTSNANAFTVVGESAREPAHNGSNAFKTRIPVLAGDHLGTGGGNDQAVALFCAPISPSDSLGVAEDDASVGSTQTFTPVVNVRLALWAAIEPDADNDGFGDETQDACPQSAAFQTPCPPVVLSTSTQVKKGSVTILVTSSTAAPVTVKGVAKLGKGKKAKMNGGTQNLLPGTINKYRLFFTKGLKNKLKELDPSKKLTLKVTVSGTSVSGAVTTKTLKVKLKGQAPTAQQRENHK